MDATGGSYGAETGNAPGERLTGFLTNNRSGRLIALVVAALTLTSLISGVWGATRDDRSQDFQWGPARELLHHGNPYTPYLEFLDGSSDTNPYMLAQAPNYPASSYVMLWPWAALEWEPARLAWALSNLGFTALLVAGVARLVPLRAPEAVLLGCLLIMGVPHRATVGNGQHALFSLAFFVWAVLADRKGRGAVAGLLLAVSWFKYTVTFPLSLLFVTRRRPFPLVVAAGVHLALTGLVAAWIGESPTHFFFQSVDVASAATEAFSGVSPSLDFLGVVSNLGIRIPGTMLLTFAALGGVALFVGRARGADDLDVVGFLALASLALFFHRHYDRVVLVFVAAAMMVRWRTTPKAVLTLVFVLTTWYVEKTFNFLINRGSVPLSEYLTAGYYWANATLFYVTLVYHARTLGSLTRREGGGAVRSATFRPDADADTVS